MLWDRANTARDLSGALPWYIWISLFRSFRLRCTVHPQQGQPQPVGGGFQPGEPEHSQLITVQTIWRSAFMFWLIDFRCFLWLCWWLSRWTSWALLPYPLPHHDSSLFLQSSPFQPHRPRRSKCLNLSFYPLFQDIFLVYWISNSSCTESVLLTIRLPVQVRQLLLVHEVD